MKFKEFLESEEEEIIKKPYVAFLSEDHPNFARIELRYPLGDRPTFQFEKKHLGPKFAQYKLIVKKYLNSKNYERLAKWLHNLVRKKEVTFHK